jgi:hypothetical protein
VELPVIALALAFDGGTVKCRRLAWRVVLGEVVIGIDGCQTAVIVVTVLRNDLPIDRHCNFVHG